ncbi:MAG TPA: lipase family protein [Rheinheimera sp.]|uniref:lipase family protein n=1 Tax=Rheinheimera sp. TaxID=1869214 RepID=UPI002F9303AE
MARPLSIQFASECAFAATSDLVDLVDRRCATSLDLGGGHIVPLEKTTFNTHPEALFAQTFPFSGNSTWSANDQMGFITKGTGSRRGEVLITFRGSTRLKDDYLYIDGGFLPGTSPKGFAVHGAFAKVFQSCLPGIRAILGDIGEYHTVHCVGHSMGGALATLCAEHFVNSYVTPYLYTFGAPRVGMLPHALYMQKHLGERLNRYYYAGDVVTWLPMLPFVHMTGKRLISPDSWSGSHIGYREPNGLVLADSNNAQVRAESWAQAEQLISQGMNAGGGCGMESRRWRYFTQAFHKILYVVGATVGLIVTAPGTVVDQIVSLISWGCTQDPKRRPLIVRWLVGSFQALGKIVTVGKDTFVAMLRYILGLMLSQIKTKTERELFQARQLEAINQKRKQVIRFNR